MRNSILIFFLLILTACGHSLKRSWSNFSAYYNTFYNAKKDFEAGLKKEKNQPITPADSALYRIYPPPLAAGTDDFNQAIQNGNEVLRHHPRSKWTDDALLLTGKSHYFLQEYYPAIQRFELLLAYPKSTPLKQKAVIWKGRALFETESYNKGTQFLKQSLTDFSGSWKPANKAETRLVLAEHLAMLEEPAEAANQLQAAIPELADKALTGRAYLLLGQLYQKNQQYKQAYQAYGRVKSNHPGYAYIYEAELRKAAVALENGNPARTVDIYKHMLGDDKNYKNRYEINYHLAEVYQKSENFDQAKRLYQHILGEAEAGNIPPRIISGAYYRLGQIYSNHYQNYQVAAAYYDSSSSGGLRQHTNDDKTRQLTSAYKRYIALHQRINRADRLLKLGRLSEGELSARLARIRKNHKREIENSKNAVQATNNKLTNVRARDVYKTTSKDTASGRFGFLSYRNARQVQHNRQKFIAIWGSRPLVDNWRRRAAITADVHRRRDSLKKNGPARSYRKSSNDKPGGIDPGAIPQTPESRQAMREQQYRLEYQLGSLFFLSLNQPDSARHYYRRVLAGQAPADLRARAQYSMYQLNHLHGKTDSAAAYKQKILQRFPGTVYAQRIRGNRTKIASRPAADSAGRLRERFQQLLGAHAAARPDSSLAVQLHVLALNHLTSPLAPALYYRAIREYIRFARARDSTQTAADSARTIPTDTAQQESYFGPDWERLRGWLADFMQRFPQAPQRSQVEAWARFLRHPNRHTAIYSCEELHVEPQIVGGKQQFVQAVQLPVKAQSVHLAGTLRYRITIGKGGEVQSYKLLSTPSHLGLEPAYEKAIKERLEFKPITKNGRPVRAACEVAFPVKQ